jgi:CRISPR-associated protein Cas10/Cmr2 subtype III-B
VRNFWRLTWQLWPWQQTAQALQLFKTVPLGTESPLHLAKDVAHAIPKEHQDSRCYKNGTLDPGWAWNAHYQLLAHRHDARRQTRDFAAWNSNGSGHKDYFSGKEEVVVTKDWLENARQKNAGFAHLFRHDDELGAINLIKRVWHKAYLQEVRQFQATEFKFSSVLSVAAAGWRNGVLNSASKEHEAWASLLDFQKAVQAAQGILDFELPANRSEEDWLQRVDASILRESYWNGLKVSEAEQGLRNQALAALRKLLKATKSGEPGKYYAVLALDGDEIGKCLSGEHTPTVESVLTSEAADYFRNEIKGVNVKQWLASNRPLSPSYHLQLSEALANFGVYAAYRIVAFHGGNLIYSGGDDVLAILPAEEALACAKGLRMAFQGSPQLVDRYPRFFGSCHSGFIKVKEGDWNRGGRRPSEPSWPLLVPGPRATVSVGIAIGHIKEPLQDMVKAAQSAEKRAKTTHNRNAVAVTLFKRSGESIEWGTPFISAKSQGSHESQMSAALDLLTFFQSNNRFRNRTDDPTYQPPISGKFPYRLAELLEPYQQFEAQNGFPDYSQPTALTEDLRKIAEKETDWAISQQCERLGASEAKEFRDLCNRYLIELEDQKRPLCEFYHVFAIEAFIARQRE